MGLIIASDIHFKIVNRHNVHHLLNEGSRFVPITILIYNSDSNIFLKIKKILHFITCPHTVLYSLYSIFKLDVLYIDDITSIMIM